MSVLKIKNQNNDWIQIPTIKGDKGDPFTYADFTPEQLESLKGKDGISPTVSVASDTSEDYRLSFTDETHTVTTPNLIPEAEKIFDVYPTDSASGSIASFPDGADDIPLKSCIVQVEPVQAGSGDPSPDNVRPISGWTGCEVRHSGEDTSNPTTYPITFPTEAGTVYGGHIDPINGELAATHAEVDMGTLTWTYYPSGNYFYAIIPDMIRYIEALPKVVSVCDKYAYFGFGTSTELQNNMPNANYGFTTTSAKRYIYLKDNRYTSVDDLVASLSETQLVYALTKNSIITYTLTQIEIPKTLLGQNNIWADTGDTEVEYRADPTLYIQKLTEPDADMVADANIVSGQYFMVGNDLYKATVNIASGASVIVGTNAVKVSLAQALNEINQ